MSNIFYPDANSIAKYDTFAVFPSSANHGDFAVALDTNILYEFNGTIWISVATPGGSAVDSVTGWNVDNTDPANPIIDDLVTDFTLSGIGTAADPLHVVGVDDGVLTAKVATTAALANTPTYSNGASGVGATLTRTGNGAFPTTDSIAIILNDIVLVKNQVAQLQNGLYQVTTLGSAGAPWVLTRTTSADTTTELDDQIVAINSGSTNGGKLFGQQTETPTVGTSNIVYAETSSGGVKQKASGTQVLGQIPWWTGTPKQLDKGTPSLVWDPTNQRLGVGSSGAPDHVIDFRYETSYVKFGRYSTLENGGVLSVHAQKRDGSGGSDIDFNVAEETGFTVTNGLANFTVGLDSISQSGVSNLMSYQNGVVLQPYSGTATPLVFYDDTFLQTISFAGPPSRTGDLKILWPIDDPTDGQTMVFSTPISNISTATWSNSVLVATGGATNLVAFFTSANDLTGESGFEYDSSTNILKADTISATVQFNKGTEFFATQDTSINTLRLGKDSGLSITTGPSNTFLGISAGRTATTPDRATFVGFEAGYTYNIAAGLAAPVVFVGYRAGKFYQGVSGHGGDVYIGDQAGLNTTTGYENTWVGHACGSSITTGIQNIGMGYGVLQSGSTGTQSFNTIIGFDSGRNVNGSSNTLYGWAVGYTGLVTGGGNIMMGVGTGAGSNNCNNNILIGNSTNSNAVDSTILIGNSLAATETSEINIGGALQANSQITKFTQLSGTISASNLCIFGRSVGAAGISGTDNSFFGYNSASFASVIGTDNSGFGSNSLQVISSGLQNTAVGKSSLASVSTGSDNAALGFNAGAGANPSRHVYLGSGSQGNHSDSISLGYGAQTTAAHQLVVGSYQTTAALADSYIDHAYFGSGITADVLHTSFTLHATGASGTDAVGLDLILAAGKSTGSANGGTVFISTSVPGSSGTTLQTLSNVVGFDTNGNIRALRLHNNDTAQGSSAEQDIRSGTYTPTLTGITNIASSTAFKSQWLRVGNTVTVSGKLTVATTATAASQINISLPVASNFAAEEDCGGAGGVTIGSGSNVLILADATNNVAAAVWTSAALTTNTMMYTFTYEVI